ncbi:MAG: efflux RND transporter permease subunit, partial [Bdellovibrionales bacterium]
MTQDPKPNTQPPKNLIEWFAHNHVAANILMMLFLVGGLVSVLSMRTETFPTIDPRLVTISVVYPGATPYEIADSITSRVEETLIGIDGVKRISSKAAEGYGLINVELQDFADADDVYNDVQTAVDSLSDFPPEEAERPKVVKTKRTPNVISLAIHGDAPEETLKYWAELIEDDLRQLDGVATTSLRGIRDYEISIEISEESLREYGLTLQDIGNAVSGFSTDIPAGTLESRQGDILLRVQQQRYHGRDFETIPIKTTENGATLYLSDIATIKDGFEDVHLISKFNGQPAAFIDVSRNDTGDTLTIAQTVKDYLQTVSLPTGVSLSLQDDKTVNLRDRISLMARNAILGFMLVFVVLLLFLDLKLAFWTSVAIPVSFLGGMMIIHLMGYSINMITLFALIVVLGVVVDDAIIVGESIFEAQNKDP